MASSATGAPAYDAGVTVKSAGSARAREHGVVVDRRPTVVAAAAPEAIDGAFRRNAERLALPLRKRRRVLERAREALRFALGPAADRRRRDWRSRLPKRSR